MAKREGTACLIVHVQRRDWTETPSVSVELGEQDAESERDGYPRTPDEVNGLFAQHLCLWAHVFEGTGITLGSVEYRDAAFVDEDKATLILKCLRRVGKRMATLREEQGQPASWAENVTRFAAATGARLVAYNVKELREWLPKDHWIHEDRTYTAKPWIFHDVAHTRDLLAAIGDAIRARFPSREAAQ